MSIASRFGKLPLGAVGDVAAWRRREDLLTSDVFGAYRYLPWSLGLGPLLASATNAEGVSLAEWARTNDVDWSAPRASIAFWPRLAGKEPDLVVMLHDADDTPRAAVLVEAKLLDDQHPIEGLSQLGFYARAMLDGQLDPDTFEHGLPALRPVVFLTADPAPRVDALRIARAELASHESAAASDAFWCNWQRAAVLASERLERAAEGELPPQVRALLDDLVADLAERGFRSAKKRRAFPLALAPLSPFAAPRLKASRTPRAAIANLAFRPLPRIDGVLRDWRLR